MKQPKKITLTKKKMNNTGIAVAKDNDGKSIGSFLWRELKPKGKFFTPFNLISIPIILLGIVLIVIRFWKGLGSVTNLTQDTPWGLWIGFDVVTGVAFAGGAYVLTFMVYILKMDKFHSIIRVTVLNGFLAYLFYAGALLLDLGRPWNVINPIIGNSFGTSSVLFLVAWHFLLYMIAELIEFSPAIAEWLGSRRARNILKGMTIGAVIFGITLSTLHQSGLGALYLMAKDKIHPLWYSEFIPILFLVSSVFAGLSMVIFEGSISHKVFSDQVSGKDHKAHEGIVHSLAKICAGAMFAYLFLQLLVFIHDKNWEYLNTPMGYWFLLEMIGFVLLPMLLFFYAYRRNNQLLIKIAAILTMTGVILNRLNVTVIGFNWDLPVHYVPSWMEFVVTLTVIFTEIWIFRWVIRRMPVLRDSPEWAKESDSQQNIR
jgi:Ni/Fe-hydrogenase subunit HybB-like protein